MSAGAAQEPRPAAVPWHSQVQGGVPIDVHHVRLHLEAALQEELHDVVVPKPGAEVQRNVIFVVLSVHCRFAQKRTQKGFHP